MCAQAQRLHARSTAPLSSSPSPRFQMVARAEIDTEKEYFLHCASGYRSLIAASIFKANGVKKVTDVRGGFKDLKETEAPMTDYVCPTTLL